jgi:glycosyltransferase involved in cell wall biosynthesis
MKVLFLIDSLGSAGKERQLLELIKGLKTRKNIQFQLVVLSDFVQYNFVNNLDIKIYFLKRKIKKDPHIFLRLLKICRDFQPDVMHSWERMCSVYGLPVAKLLGVKFIHGVIRNAPSNLKPSVKGRIKNRIMFVLSDVVVANSYAGLKSAHVPKHKGCCIHNGFDFTRTKNLQGKEFLRKKFQIDSSNVVGMVGRFNRKKDYKTFLLSAMQILKKRKDVIFLAVGDGSDVAGETDRSTYEICQEMVKSEFNDRVKFLGRQNNIESIINLFDIGVLLTDQEVHGEGISNSIMEYMALAKPVIATDGGGTGEIVVRDETGFLVKNANVEQVVEKIEILMNHKEIAKTLGHAGKQRLLKAFSLEKMTDRYVELYRNSNLCSRNKKPSRENNL